MVLDLVLFEDFDGNFVAGHYMRTLLHFTEGTLSFCLANDEAANDLAFTILFFLWVFGRLCAGRITSFVAVLLIVILYGRRRRLLISRRFLVLHKHHIN